MSLVLGAYRFVTRPISVGALEYSAHRLSTVGGVPQVQGIATADLDDDTDIDIVAAGGNDLVLYEHRADGSFKQKIIAAINAERVQIIDLNGDGSKDILVTVPLSDPSIRWFQNTGTLEYESRSLGSGKGGKAYAGDIDGDGATDIVTAITSGDAVVLSRWMNNGSGTFTSTTLSATSGVTALTVGDVDGDGFQDIVTGGTSGLQRWDTTNGYTWTKDDIDTANRNGTSIVVADVSGEGRNDIVTGDMAGNVVAVYRHVDITRFDRIALSGDADAATVSPIDIDSDGDVDVVVAAEGDNSIFWFENNGSMEFTKKTLISNLQDVFGLSTVDIDKDNDIDVVTGDFGLGTVWWYERVRAKSVATSPDNIQQTTDGASRVLFDTTISNSDFNGSRIRIQYSTDGQNWYKPWLLEVRPSVGSVDLKNSNVYQVGTSNAIDTDDNASVKLTLVWDTKSSENTGGPIVGDISTVKLRIIPNDGKSNGSTVTSPEFRVDNRGPQGLAPLLITLIGDNEATFSWSKPTDSSSYTYKLYYGTDRNKVLSQTSDVWDSSDDSAMSDMEATTTTITGLSPLTTYTFKLYAIDSFGNVSGTPSVVGTTSEQAIEPQVTATPFSGESPLTSPFETPQETLVIPTPPPPFMPTPTVGAAPTPVLRRPPSTLSGNQAPQADAGLDQVVNPAALVILDGTGSSDPEGDTLTFSWTQLSGPKIDVVSERTATPSFSAGDAGETYIFMLTVRDSRGASATDTVTVATKSLPVLETSPVAAPSVTPTATPEPKVAEPTVLGTIARYTDISFFALALASTLLSLTDRMVRLLRDRAKGIHKPAAVDASFGSPRGVVVHYRTGKPILGARVRIYDVNGKLKKTEVSNDRGEFPTLFPVGRYSISVGAEGLSFAPADASSIRPKEGIVYTGGKIAVSDSSKPLTIVIPMKPIGEQVTSSRVRLLRMWQAIQRVGRASSWPLFVAGALLNTILVFWTPGMMYLVFEVLYVLLVVTKVIVEVKVRPAYGLVRNAITHVPVDLAVVRLFEQGTNKLIMTRVTNAQGKFFALPPPGMYTVTVTKLGYAMFTKENVEISIAQDSVLQVTADLMPVAPSAGVFTQAQAVV